MSEETLFAEALARKTPEERSAYLDQACAGNAELRARVESLLRAHNEPDSFFDAPAVPIPETISYQPLTEGPSTRIGPYKLLQKLGEGGMGTVYMAEQTQPVERKVAIKIIKPGMDTRQVIARFEAERQALAIMDHPNIAKVLDAGSTVAGCPYFVMELVKGVPITRYCDEHRLPPPERLELFVLICHGVQHAHQKGVIHRDIKPSNVLVAEYDDHAVPKIIDFGLAKAIGFRLTQKTVFTEFGQIIGTIPYMSPEQAKLNQLDIDTRCDIYALGVLLYELLAGEPPFDPKRLQSVALDEMLRIIRDEEPLRPSARLSASQSLPSIAANRHLDPKQLSTLVRGELDWIALRAMEKDRTRRYETANSLANDVIRYLKNEPVKACPPSFSYRVSKALRRNKAAVIVVTMIALSLLLGLVATSAGLVYAIQAWGEVEAARENEAEQRGRAEDNEKAAIRALKESNRLAAIATYFHAQNTCEQGQVIRGLLHLALGLGFSVDAESPELEQAFRLNLDAWSREMHCLASVLAHPELVRAVAISPDNRVVATACDDGKVRLFELIGGKEIGSPLCHPGPLKSLVFDPVEGSLLTGCDDGMVRRWNILSGNLTEILFAHPEAGDSKQKNTPRRVAVACLAISADGRKLLCLGEDKKLRFLNLKTSKITDTACTEPIDYAAWGRDNRTVFCLSGEFLVIVLDSENGRRLRDLRTGYRCKYVDASSSSDRFLVGNRTGMCALQIDANTGLFSGPPFRHLWEVQSVNYSPDGSLIVTAGDDCTARVWDAQTGEPVGTSIFHPSLVGTAKFSRDGQYVITASDDHIVRIWRLAKGNKGLTLRHPRIVRSADFSPNGRFLYTGLGTTQSTNLWKWDLGTCSPIKFDSPRLGWVQDLLVSKDGKTIYTHTGEEGPSVLNSFDADNGELKVKLVEHPTYFNTGVWLSPDNKTLLTGAGIKLSRAQLWDTKTGKPVGKPLEHSKESPISTVGLSPNGLIIVTCGHDKMIRFWDSMTGQPLGPPVRRDHVVTALAFHPGGKIITTGGLDGTLLVWDRETEKVVGGPIQHSGRINRIFFTPDGFLMLTCSQDHTARAWHSQSGMPVGPVRQHKSNVEGLACSRDGRQAATGSDDGTARIWALPVPLQGTPGEIRVRLERATGMKLADNGAIVPVREDHSHEDTPR